MARWFCLGLLGVLALGCDDGSEDGQAACLEREETEFRCSPGCVPDATPYSLDQATPDGVTAAARLEVAAGLRTGTLTWEGGGGSVVVEPSSGTTDIEVELTHDGGSIEWITYDHCDYPEGTNHLEVETQLHLTTADGALGEVWPVRAIADVGSDGLRVATAMEDWDARGSFDAQAGDSWVRLHVEASFGPSESAGRLVVESWYETGDPNSEEGASGGGSSPTTAARWSAN